MSNIIDMLDELQNRALREPDVREKLLSTKIDKDPLSAFCRVCRELGYEIYEMELVCAGEEFHAAMRRDARESTFRGRKSPRTTASSAPAAPRLPAALRASAVAA